MTYFLCFIGLALFIGFCYLIRGAAKERNMEYKAQMDYYINKSTLMSKTAFEYNNNYNGISDPMQLIKIIENNTKCLITEFNTTYKKQPNAHRYNIHYTIMLPLLRGVNQKNKFVFCTPPTTLSEKQLLNSMLKNSTPMFCLCYMLLKSPDLNAIVKRDFSLPTDMANLLKVIGKPVAENISVSTDKSYPQYSESIEMLNVVKQISWVHSNI